MALRAGLCHLPGLPAPLREGRELAPAAWREGLRLLPGSLLRFAKGGSFTYADRPTRLRLVRGICRSEALDPAEGRPWLPFSDKPLFCLRPGTSV